MPTNLILSRAASPSSPLDLPAPFSCHRIIDPTDAAFPLLDRLYSSDGFPAGWAGRMLERGAQAVLIESDGTPAASALLIRRPFYVQEIRRTFDVGPDADYYFGDFVSPEFRGKHLQRALILARLRMTCEAGRKWALAMTRATLPASLDNYRTEGFVTTVELRSKIFWRWQVDHYGRLNRDLPQGNLSREGVGLPFSLRLRRRQN